VWTLDSSGNYVSEGSPETIGSGTWDLETQFQVDLDVLNGIGAPAVVELTSTSVSGTQNPEYFIPLVDQSIVEVNGVGGPDAYQLYNSDGIAFVGSGVNDYLLIRDFSPDDRILLQGTPGDYVIFEDLSLSRYSISTSGGDLIALVVGGMDLASQIVYL
jgi:hypothetical protein